jgi:hypothetical protein
MSDINTKNGQAPPTFTQTTRPEIWGQCPVRWFRTLSKKTNFLQYGLYRALRSFDSSNCAHWLRARHSLRRLLHLMSFGKSALLSRLCRSTSEL